MTNSLPLWAENLAVFDTETTGVDTSQARVVSCTIALLSGNGEVRERYDWLIDPGVDIPEAAVAVHGITTDVARTSGVEASVGIAQVVAQLLQVIDRGFPLVAYNAPYDLTLLRAEAERYAIEFPSEIAPVLDPLVIDKQVDRYRKGKRTLEAVTAYYGVALSNAHDAGEDAIAAGRVMQAQALRYAHVLPEQVMELHEQQVGWAKAQADNFQEYMRRVKDSTFVAEGGWPLR